MDRKKFFQMIENEYFTVEEGHNIATEEFREFDVESTALSKLMANPTSKNDLFNFLVYEKEKDNWCFLCEEFAGYFMQMLSTNHSVSGINSTVIEQIEGFYYNLINGLLQVTASVHYDTKAAKDVYINHMVALRSLMETIMDLEELKTHI